MAHWDWNDIRIVLEAGRQGSFAGAATTLDLNQATVSRRIAALEKSSGVTLFRRSAVGAVLTDSGRELFRRAVEVESGAQEFHKCLSALSSPLAEPVAVKASEGIATYYLTPLIARHKIGPMGVVLDELPEIRLPPIRIISDQSPEPADIEFSWVVPGSTPRGKASDHIRQLARVRFLPITSTTYAPPTGEMPRHFEDISEHPLVTLSVYRFFNQDNSLAAWNLLMSKAQEGCMAVEWCSALERLLTAGSGITVLPSYSPLFSDKLFPPLLDVPDMFMELWLRASEENLKDAQVRKTFDQLSRAFHAFRWS